MDEITSLNTAIVNVHSLVSVAKRVEFENFLKKYKPHIVLISETHLKPKHNLNFVGYKIYRSDRENSGGGGTAVCISDRIESEHIEKPDGIKSLESCSVKVNLKNGAIIFSAIYRRPTVKIINTDLTDLINIDKNVNFVIGGDFNAHAPLWGGSTICTNGKEIDEWFHLNKNTLKMSILGSKKPTCNVSASGSFIDFAILSDNLNVTNCDIGNKLPSRNIFSDHAVIFLNINCEPVKLTIPSKIKMFKKTNWKKFNSFIDHKIINLNIPLECNMFPQQIDDTCASIEAIFKEAVEKLVPEIEISNANVDLSKKSLNLLKEKKRLMRKRYRNRNNQHFDQIKSQLRLLNQLLVQSISDDYHKWWSNRIKNIKPDNNLFKNIKQISSYKKMQSPPSTMHNDDKSISYSTNATKCEALACRFAQSHELTYTNSSSADPEVNQIFTEYDNNEPIVFFSPELPADFKDNSSVVQDNNINRKFVSVSELQSIIKSRNTKKSSGADDMPNYALRKLTLTTIYWISVLFNHITNTQHFPTGWKIAAVTPIPKPGKNQQFLSYWRPISQLPMLSKCYEKLIDINIRNFCDQNNILDQHQFGFQPGCSTLHPIAKVITDISKGLNNGRPTLAALIDLQSAFDVIWQKGLIFKMHKLKFEPHMIKIVKSFLQNRKFFVKFQNSTSSIKNIIAGTPQGSIISAILFILYLNDLPKPNNFFCQITRLLFADDIIVYTTTKNIQLATLAMNNYLNEIYKFFVKWKLKMNVNKCDSIAFVGHYKDLNTKIRKDATEAKLKINNQTINKVKSVKYLGLVFSTNFQFIDHVKHIFKKVNSAQSLLANVFSNKYVSQIVKVIAYKQLIRPLVMYASPCWLIKNLISSHQVETIRRKERWFLRKALNIYKQENSNKFVNSKELYDKTKINRIDREIIKNNLNFVDKNKNHKKTIIAEIFGPPEPDIDTIKYKPINYYHHLESNDRLHENELCLIFNKKKYHPNEDVYVKSQNLTDV